MEENSNYTPLDLDRFNLSFSKKGSGKNLNMILLIIATISAAVLAALLFILIQKKRLEQQSTPVPQKVKVSPIVTSKLKPTITTSEVVSPTIIVSPSVASVSPTLISPSQAEKGASPSAFRQ